MIPEQLKEFQFILLKPQSKEAFEKNWQTTASYSFNDPKLVRHLKDGGNYGVLAGAHVIVESDTLELEEIIELELPETFTQRSPGHHSKHFFYNGISRIIPLFDKSKPKGKDNVGHVKSGPSYVVGPGSLHPNGGRYEVVDSRQVATVTDEQLRQVLTRFIAQRALASEKTEAKKQRTAETFSILDLIPGLGLKEHGGQLQGPHPVHGSETGTNFSVNPTDNVWHCFRCQSGGGPWHLLAVLERIIDCQDSQSGLLKGDLFRKTRDIALERGLVKRAVPVLSAVDDKPQLTEDAEPAEVAAGIMGILDIRTIFQGEMYVYEAGVYHPGGEAIIRRVVETNFQKAGADKTATNHFLNEVLGHIERRTYVKPDSFDPDPHILNLQNGLLDVNTGTVKPHTPEYPSLACLPVDYDPHASCEKWRRFLGEVLHPEDSGSVQEFIGSLLWKGYETQKGWLQVGEGSNGKDTLCRVLILLLGRENVSSHSLQALAENRFAAADLYGKLANIYSDLEDRALKSTGVFKTLTGQGRLSGEKKFQNPFDFTNHAKLIFSCNKIPLSPDDSDAFFRRWFITTFPRQFVPANWNPNLVAELTTSTELSGILNWALEGLKRLRAQNWQLSDSKSIDEIRQDYIRKSDQVKAFVLDCCIADPAGAVSKTLLFNAFIKYVGARKLPPVTSDTFYKRLPMAGISVSQAKLGPEKARVPSFKGLWLRIPENWGKELDDDKTEKFLTDQANLDLTLRSRTGGQGGQAGHDADSMSRVSGLSGGLRSKRQVSQAEEELGECSICGETGKLGPGRDNFLRCKKCLSEQPEPETGP